MVAAPKPADETTLLSVRKEVQDFTQAAERLLSPALLIPELTADECDLIKQYVMMMSNANIRGVRDCRSGTPEAA